MIYFSTRQVRRMRELRIAHEAAEAEARALGIEAEAKALWRERCIAAKASLTDRPPTLRACVREVLFRQAGWNER